MDNKTLGSEFEMFKRQREGIPWKTSHRESFNGFLTFLIPTMINCTRSRGQIFNTLIFETWFLAVQDSSIGDIVTQ